jgi:hypothetical protein
VHASEQVTVAVNVATALKLEGLGVDVRVVVVETASVKLVVEVPEAVPVAVSV